jgi:hypothetical protein
VAVNIHRLSEDSAAVHLIDYAYDAVLDVVPPRSNVQLSVRLPQNPTHATAVMPTSETVELEVVLENGCATVNLAEFALYCIVVFHRGNLRDLRLSTPRSAMSEPADRPSADLGEDG